MMKDELCDRRRAAWSREFSSDIPVALERRRWRPQTSQPSRRRFPAIACCRVLRSEGSQSSVQGVAISGAGWERTGDVSLRLTRFHFTREVSLRLSGEEVRIGSAPSNTLTGKSKLPGKSQASGARGNQLPWRWGG